MANGLLNLAKILINSFKANKSNKNAKKLRKLAPIYF